MEEDHVENTEVESIPTTDETSSPLGMASSRQNTDSPNVTVSRIIYMHGF